MRKIGSSLSIVYLYDSFEDNDAVHLLMDLCEGAELLGAIRKGATYTEADAAELVRSVIRTAAQCHSRGIIFRDIKPDNFLFERDEPGSPLKATDFGLAGLITPGERLQRRCGTPSPRLLYTTRSDSSADASTIPPSRRRRSTFRSPSWPATAGSPPSRWTRC